MLTITLQELLLITSKSRWPTSSSSMYRDLPPDIVESIRAHRASMKDAEHQRIDRPSIPRVAPTGPRRRHPDRKYYRPENPSLYRRSRFEVVQLQVMESAKALSCADGPISPMVSPG